LHASSINTMRDLLSRQDTTPMDSTAPSAQMDASARRRAILLLAVAIFTLSVGMNVHMAMNVNFIDKELSASP
jgi:hypothetical protein